MDPLYSDYCCLLLKCIFSEYIHCTGLAVTVVVLGDLHLVCLLDDGKVKPNSQNLCKTVRRLEECSLPGQRVSSYSSVFR